MSNARIEQGLIIAALAAAIGGCAGPQFTGPPVMVEERRIPQVDRARVFQVKNLAPGKTGKKQEPAQSFCDNNAGNLIHPLHFDTDRNTSVNVPCPLLFWEVRTVREESQITPRPR